MSELQINYTLFWCPYFNRIVIVFIPPPPLLSLLPLRGSNNSIDFSVELKCNIIILFLGLVILNFLLEKCFQYYIIKSNIIIQKIIILYGCTFIYFDILIVFLIWYTLESKWKYSVFRSLFYILIIYSKLTIFTKSLFSSPQITILILNKKFNFCFSYFILFYE